ncbi:MAG: hypothetical protein R3E82_01240 [Pseudomonadales bacterium]
MEDESSEGSIRDWIDRARRAHDLVERVDLRGVAAHDPQAVEKLKKVGSALDELSAGRDVQYIDGVDEDEAPTLDEEQMRRSELMIVLSQAGLSDRLGRVYVEGTTNGTVALDIVPHREGLPEFDVCVAPDHSPADGAHGIFVSQLGVFSALIPAPPTRHRWRILRSRPFDDQREMLDIIRHFMDSGL